MYRAIYIVERLLWTKVVGNVAVLLSFSAQARGIQLYEVDCHHLVIGNRVAVRRNVSQNDKSRAKRVTPM